MSKVAKIREYALHEYPMILYRVRVKSGSKLLKRVYVLEVYDYIFKPLLETITLTQDEAIELFGVDVDKTAINRWSVI